MTFESESELNFIIDSGATQHLVNVKSAFVNLRPISRRIGCENKSADTDLLISHEGDIVIESEGKLGLLENVLYVPDLQENLFSVRKVMGSMRATFTQKISICVIYRGTWCIVTYVVN